ncbi:MAG: hypothetical protein ACI9EV_002232 [Urechidicola sp.]|jgi:hypothetical protein
MNSIMAIWLPVHSPISYASLSTKARELIDGAGTMGAAREKFRKFDEFHNYESKAHFLNVSKETRLNRVIKRNTEKGETFEFEVSKENFDFMETWFENPTDAEMSGGMIVEE